MAYIKILIEIHDHQIDLLNNNDMCKVIVEGKFVKAALKKGYRDTFNVEVIPIKCKLPEPEHTEYRKDIARIRANYATIQDDTDLSMRTRVTIEPNEIEPASEADVTSKRYKAWLAKYLHINV